MLPLAHTLNKKHFISMTMTTAVSTHSTSSLRRTTELCSSELSHLHDIGVSTSDNSSRSCAIFEDEEMSSVEAEGSSSSDPNDEETSEKQLLTAALVTSIVELAGTNTSQPRSIGMETRRRSLRKRQLTKRRVHSTNQTLLSSKCASKPVASEILQDAVMNFTNESSINPNSMVPNPLVRQDILISASKNFSNMSHLSGQSAENFESQYQADGLAPGVDEVECQGRGRFFSIDLDCKFLYCFLGGFHSLAHQTISLSFCSRFR